MQHTRRSRPNNTRTTQLTSARMDHLSLFSAATTRHHVRAFRMTNQAVQTQHLVTRFNRTRTPQTSFSLTSFIFTRTNITTGRHHVDRVFQRRARQSRRRRGIRIRAPFIPRRTRTQTLQNNSSFTRELTSRISQLAYTITVQIFL